MREELQAELEFVNENDLYDREFEEALMLVESKLSLNERAKAVIFDYLDNADNTLVSNVLKSFAQEVYEEFVKDYAALQYRKKSKGSLKKYDNAFEDLEFLRQYYNADTFKMLRSAIATSKLAYKCNDSKDEDLFVNHVSDFYLERINLFLSQ